MRKNHPLQIRLQDPLSEVTRKERRMLMSISMLSLLVSKAGFIPNKISALGIDFGQINQQSFIYILAVIIGYFTLSFLLYSTSDFLTWQFDYDESRDQLFTEHMEKISNLRSEQSDNLLPRKSITNWLNINSKYIAIIRNIFEFFLPIFTGCYSIYALVCVIK